MLLPTRVLGLLNRQNLIRGQEIQLRLFWGPCCSSREWEQTTGSLAWFLRWGDVRGVSRVAWRHGLNVLPTLQMVVCPGDMHSTLLLLLIHWFASGSSKVAVGFFGLFVYLGSIFSPNCACMSWFLVPFCFQRRSRAAASTAVLKVTWVPSHSECDRTSGWEPGERNCRPRNVTGMKL